MKEHNYIVAATKPWCIDAFNQYFLNNNNWFLITEKEQLTSALLSEIKPKYIFFPHWNWFVPKSITEVYECVCFHMTNVPYGRGGSPLQNLIIRGHEKTKLTALRMVEELDAGPVYTKIDLSLEGRAQDIFERTAPKMMDLAKDIAKNEPTPTEQSGQVTTFQRRSPKESEILDDLTIEQVYDHIRMLDADTYPKGFLATGLLKFELSDVKKLNDGTLSAQVIISEKKSEL